tara:strand:+ start:137 stop:400 length:264 start_codon:yes stop_codon:yes gene_type:complete
MKPQGIYILKKANIKIRLAKYWGKPHTIKNWYYKIMSFEEELEAIEREEWLNKFNDRQVMNAARMFLEWLYHLPDDWQPQEYSEFTF